MEKKLDVNCITLTGTVTEQIDVTTAGEKELFSFLLSTETPEGKIKIPVLVAGKGDQITWYNNTLWPGETAVIYGHLAKKKDEFFIKAHMISSLIDTVYKDVYKKDEANKKQA